MVSKIQFVKGFNRKNFAYVHVKWQFQFSLRNCLLNSLRIASVSSRAFTAFVVFHEAANLPNSRALFFLFASITVHVCRVCFAADLENRSFPVCCTHASDVMSHGWTMKKNLGLFQICTTRHAIFSSLGASEIFLKPVVLFWILWLFCILTLVLSRNTARTPAALVLRPYIKRCFLINLRYGRLFQI